jgi:hypothetical protein
MSKTNSGEARLVKEGTILVMASATVGRAIVATKAHENAIISHHFMRVDPLDVSLAGWVYAYLRSPQAQAMMRGSQYASVIRHIEPRHLATLPVPEVSEGIARAFNEKVAEIIACRNDAAHLRDSAESMFSDAVGEIKNPDTESGFSVHISNLANGRRRFEATYHTPYVQAIVRRFKKWEQLGSVAKRVWWGNRFKRHYGESGIPYLSADDVFTTNPYEVRRILVDPEDGHESFFVKRGWIVMACSGQIYGLNGAATIATEWHENTFFSHDIIRIEPKDGARAGYLLTALTHPKLGRPLLIREAYGMSIPHLDPGDVASFPVVRLDKHIEDKIADLAEEATLEQARAEVLERELSEAAGKIVSEFLLSSSLTENAMDVQTARLRLAEIAAHPERLVSGKELNERLARIKP